MSGTNVKLLKNDPDHYPNQRPRSGTSEVDFELDGMPSGLQSDPELEDARWDPAEVAPGFRKAVRGVFRSLLGDFGESLRDFINYMANLKNFSSKPGEQKYIQRVFSFEYDNEKQTYKDSFRLPVFAELPEIIFNSEFKPNKAQPLSYKDRINGALFFTITALKLARESFSKGRSEARFAMAVRIHNNPFLNLIIGRLRLLDMAYVFFWVAVLEYSYINFSIPAAISLTKVALKILGVSAAVGSLGFSFLFLSTSIYAYFRIPKLVEQINAKLDDVEKLVENKDHRNSYSIVSKLSNFPYGIVLDDNYPGYGSLKYRYHYLHGSSIYLYSKCASGFSDAIKYADTVEQRFLCVRGAINSEYTFFKELSRQKEYPAAIEQYVRLITSDSVLHKQLGAKLRQETSQCLSLLVNGEIKAARSLLHSIDFDAYSKEAFPDVAVIYYQLRAIMWLVSKQYEEDYDSTAPTYPDGRRVLRSTGSILLAQSYLEKYYPQQAELHQGFVNDITGFWDSWPFTEKQNKELRAGNRGVVLKQQPAPALVPQYAAKKPEYVMLTTDRTGNFEPRDDEENSDVEDAPLGQPNDAAVLPYTRSPKFKQP